MVVKPTYLFFRGAPHRKVTSKSLLFTDKKIDSRLVLGSPSSIRNLATLSNIFQIWVFPKIGVPQNGWFIMEIPIKMDDLRVPPFLETPISSQMFGIFQYSKPSRMYSVVQQWTCFPLSKVWGWSDDYVQKVQLIKRIPLRQVSILNVSFQQFANILL